MSQTSRQSSFRAAVQADKSAADVDSWHPPRASQQSDQLCQEFTIAEHRIELHRLEEFLATSFANGLSEDEAAERLLADGPNRLEPQPTAPMWLRVARSAVSGFSLLLLAGGLLSLVAFAVTAEAADAGEEPMDSLAIGLLLLAVVAVNAALSSYQEMRAEQLAEKYKDSLPQTAIVRRAGRLRRIPVSQLVYGGLVEISAGDQVPADVRILTAERFRVDNSPLTGDPQPELKSADYTSENPLETENLAFYSTFAAEGRCTALVIRTGSRTLMGQVANLTTNDGGLSNPAAAGSSTPVVREVELFVQICGILAAAVGLAFFVAAFSMQYDWLQSLMLLMGSVLAFLPEGLTVIVTACLRSAAQRMSDKRCHVRSLAAVENFGRCSVVCTGKTGALTTGRMTASHTWHSGRIWDTGASEWSSAPTDARQSMLSGADWPLLARCVALSCRAEVSRNGTTPDRETLPFSPDPSVSLAEDGDCCLISGNATDLALLQFAEWGTPGGAAAMQRLRELYPKLCEVPFTRDSRFQASVHSDGAEHLLVLKGAPEAVIRRCDSVLCDGRSLPFAGQWRDAALDACLELASAGERVLAFCDLRLPAEDFPPGYPFDSAEVNFPLEAGMRLLGLVSLIDPLRPAALEAVAWCRSVGVKVLLVTGDHPAAARAAARHCGLIDCRSKTPEDLAAERGVALDRVDPLDADARVLTGEQLEDLSADQLDKIVDSGQELVFARISPRRKLLIVECCQRLGHTVAVTGRDAADCPTLRRAQIGVAAGGSPAATDAARQSSDAVLAEPSFAIVASAISEGRAAFRSLRRSVAYALCSNLPQAAAFLLYFICGLPLPIGAVTLLCIDLGTNLVPALAHVFFFDDGGRDCDAATSADPTDPRQRGRRRLIGERVLSTAFGQIGVVETVGALFAYFAVMAENGFWPWRLVGLRREWDSPALLDIEDSYGQEWSYQQRLRLLRTAHAAFFASLLLLQWAALFATGSRAGSRRDNRRGVGAALLFETGLAILLVYCPGLNLAVLMQPLRFTWWLPALPFALFVLAHEALRHLLLRLELPGRWLQLRSGFLDGF